MKKIMFVVLASVVLAGCSLQTLKPQSPPKPQSQSQTPRQRIQQQVPQDPTQSLTVSAEADKTIEISASNFTYDKKEIRVKKGEKVAVKFTNGEGFHDFVIDELDVKTQRLPEGQSETVMIPTDKVGEYAYYCSVGSHRAQGMEGKLIIE